MVEEGYNNRRPLIVATVVLLLFVFAYCIIAYFMVSCLDCGGMWQDIELDLGKGKPTNTSNEYRFDVIYVSKPERLSEFRIMIFNSSSDSDAIKLNSLDELKAEDATENGLLLRFCDIQNDDVLNRGDFFILWVPDNKSNYDIVIVWKSIIILRDIGSIHPSEDIYESQYNGRPIRPGSTMGSHPSIGAA